VVRGDHATLLSDGRVEREQRKGEAEQVELCILITVPTPAGYGGSFSHTQHAIVNDHWFAVVHEPMFALAYELANTAQRIGAAPPPIIVWCPARVMLPPPA
jgi:hypothetical protein